ncbi:MAG: hypothetical protein HDQ99_04260 [Lachnospiraceae bacterium]|nr:hypothetical protein [Lachnospiraceae bacterium]
MNDLFNTPFETGLRVMLILYSFQSHGMTIDRITSYDFMTIYGSDLGVSEKNLHGINHFSFSELTSKRATCAEGVKSFVLDGLISVNHNRDGFLYSLTASGKKYVESLESDYKTQYLEIVNAVHKKYGKNTDTELIKTINQAAVSALRR